jgi:nicotinamidase-related amidase
VRPWEGVVPPEEIALHERRQGSIQRAPRFGERIAVVVVDMTREFTDSAFHTGHSETGDPAVVANAELLEVARAAGCPVVFTRQLMQDDVLPGVTGPRRWTLTDQGGALLQNPTGGSDFDERILPLAKPKPSGFHGTFLQDFLTTHRVDTVVVTGMVTSGCVRATVIDAYMNNHFVVVPEECTADWSPFQHATSLFDMHVKYADVAPLADVVAHLRALA